MAKIQANEDGFQNLLNLLKENMTEERDMALERYRVQDAQIENNEQFILQGKHLVDFLKTASDRTDSLMTLTKMVADIIYKKDAVTGGPVVDDDKMKSEILNQLKELEKNKTD